MNALAAVLGLALAFLQSAPSPAANAAARNGWPAVSPDGTRIAFLSSRSGAENIFVISASGGNEAQVTHMQEGVSSLSWSRDGKQIRFAVVDGMHSTKIYSIDADGANQRQIGQVPGQGAELSPDGKRVIYNASRSWTSSRLMVSGLDGSDARQITEGSSVAWNRRWSPDGAMIAFTGKDSSGNAQVFLMKADGTELRQLTRGSPAEGGAQVPDWSPDGRRIAMQVNRGRGYAEIWIADSSSGSTEAISRHEQQYLDEWPAWFPDGKRIAFQSNRTGSMQVWSMNADGSDPRQITR
jgi:TolB protein